MSKFGPITSDYFEGSMMMSYKGKTVFLKREEVNSKVRVIDHAIDVQKEQKKGNQVLLAHLFNLEVEGRKEEAPVHLSLLPLLEKYSALFQEPVELPPVRDIDHIIPLKDEGQVVKLRPYRFSFFQKLEIEKIVDELLKNSFISPSTSPYSSPILLVKKKDYTWRMCVDYMRLNENTIKNKFSIPVIDDLLDELKHAHVFSKLNLELGTIKLERLKGISIKQPLKPMKVYMNSMSCPLALLMPQLHSKH